jgi:glucan biosynthesis protein C
MHLGDFPQYIFLFAAGFLAARRGWLPKLRYSLGIRWLTLVLPIGFGAWLAILLTDGSPKANDHAYFGGWHWQAAAICLWESFTCVALCFGLLVHFREKFNSQGRLAKFLSDNAFSVYVFHPPIVIFAARGSYRHRRGCVIHAKRGPVSANPVAKQNTLSGGFHGTRRR